MITFREDGEVEISSLKGNIRFGKRKWTKDKIDLIASKLDIIIHSLHIQRLQQSNIVLDVPKDLRDVVAEINSCWRWYSYHLPINNA